MDPAMLRFATFYSAEFAHKFVPGERGEPRVLGQAEPRRCRVCGRGSEEATFDKDAHVIPRALGNRVLLTYEECDECNAQGSDLERHLALMLSDARVMSNVQTGKGAIKNQAERNSPAAVVNPNDGSANIIFVGTEDDDSFGLDFDGEGHYDTRTRTPMFRLMRAAKALARMGYLALPASLLARYEHLRRWIRGEVEYHPGVLVVAYPKITFTHSEMVAYVRVRSDPRIADLMVLYTFADHRLMVFLPDASMTEPDILVLPPGIQEPPRPGVQPTAVYTQAISDEPDFWKVERTGTCEGNAEFDKGSPDWAEMNRLLGKHKPKTP